MKQIKLEDFKLIFDSESVCRKDISDEEYFSSKYGKYLSNSRIGNINPEQGGSKDKYKNPPKISTTSLQIGRL